MSKRKGSTTETKLISSLRKVEKPLRRLEKYLEGLSEEERKEFEAVVKKGVVEIAKEKDRNRREILLIALAVKRQLGTKAKS